MKTLSIRQPWADLISLGIKDVENRSWRTNFRGWFLLHAGKKIDPAGYEAAKKAGVMGFLDTPEAIMRGGIIAKARLVDCVENCDSAWFTGPFGFVISEVQPLLFRPLAGKLGFFEVKDQ